MSEELKLRSDSQILVLIMFGSFVSIVRREIDYSLFSFFSFFVADNLKKRINSCFKFQLFC